MADYITRIRTIDGDKQIDYNSLANLPDLDKPIDYNSLVNLPDLDKPIDYNSLVNLPDLDKPIDYNSLVNLPDLDNKSDIDHQHTSSEVGALSIAGGIMEGTLTVNGIILTEGIDYGSGDPGVGVLGQLYFKKVT